MKVLHGGFTFFSGTASEEDMSGGIGKKLGGQFETDASVRFLFY
jgi:hypothetical protein